MPRIDAYLIAGGRWHDINFARLELLKLLAENEDVRVRVGEDYSNTEAIAAADFLISYTCDIHPTVAQQEVVRDTVAAGRRWFALHGTNSVMDFQADGVHCPRDYPTLMETLGSQFIAHPAIEPYPITVSESAHDHPLVAGIEPWETEDELYLCDYHGEITPLLETRWAGNSGPGFYEHDWPKDEPRLVMYLHPVGDGEVLYLTPGHRRSKYDMQDPPLSIPEYPNVEEGAWAVPTYYELLRRGIAWAASATPRA